MEQLTHRAVWFCTNRRKAANRERTAKLILDRDKATDMSISDISRLFPAYESRKMERFCFADFTNFDEAFAANPAEFEI